MSLQDILSALQPRARRELRFLAAKRNSPALREAPLVEHLELLYKQWDGPPLSFAEDFGKKGGQVYSRDGADPLRSCNEVEVAKRLRQVRDHAVWISSYSPSQIPSLWRPWTSGPSEAPSWLLELDREIRALTSRASGGIPDVVAWNNDNARATALFVECKGLKETFKESQEDWVAAAIDCGIRSSQIAVAVRLFV
jgi:hypothetical protein